jgi:O-antigen/teichoic acid export membrane protein
VDRIVTGAGFGAAAVSSYVICAQLAQPIYGVAAAGLHFLFPYLASREAVRDKGALRRGVMLAVFANAVFVCAALAALLVLGKSVLRLWGGEAIAGPGAALLPVIACSAALPALGLAGVYSMLALGQARTVAFLNVAGAVAMLVSAPVLMNRFGVAGMGYARLLYGPFILAVYLPLVFRLARKPEADARIDSLSCEEV